MSSESRYEVVAGIYHHEGKILMGRRSSQEGRFAGYWEFPGGKIEEGEEPDTALVREFEEEIKCKVLKFSLFRSVEWTYPDRVITVRFYFVRLCRQDPNEMALEAHSELQWFDLEEALQAPILPANKEIIELMIKEPEAVPQL